MDEYQTMAEWLQESPFHTIEIEHVFTDDEGEPVYGVALVLGYPSSDDPNVIGAGQGYTITGAFQDAMEDLRAEPPPALVDLLSGDAPSEHP